MARLVFFVITVVAITICAYADDGDVDVTFGNGGRVTTDVLWRDGTFLSTLAQQPDGKIIMAGTVQPAGFGTASTSQMIFVLSATTPTARWTRLSVLLVVS